MATVTPPSQTKWRAANTVAVNITISKNADPELFDLFVNAPGQRGVIAKELFYEALRARKEIETPAD